MMKNKLFYYLIAIACLGCQHKEGNKEQISYLLKQDTVNKSSVAMVPDESSFEMRLYAEVLPVTEDRVYFTIYNHSDREAVFGDDVKIEYYDTHFYLGEYLSGECCLHLDGSSCTFSWIL